MNVISHLRSDQVTLEHCQSETLALRSVSPVAVMVGNKHVAHPTELQTVLSRVGSLPLS